MTMASFLRFTGWCSMISGVLFVSLAIWYNISMDAFGSYVNLVGMLFLLLGLVGFYLRQMNAFGILGFIIFILVFLGGIMWTGHSWVVSFLVPALEDSAPALLEEPPVLIMTGFYLSLYPFYLGILLFGLMTAVKGILPRWAAVILVAVPILDFIPYGFYVAQPLAGVALMWLGYSLWKGEPEVQEN